jgi:GNAT superfamily N-acetyltransferase
MSQITIGRCAEPLTIAQIHAATVAVAYRPFFPGSPPPTVDMLARTWAARLADPTAVVLLATRDGRPVGSVLARADPQFPGGQLAGLHVLPSEWGERIGSALHDGALAALSAAGHRTAGLWVIAANDRARRMYERRGWTLQPGVEQVDYGISEVRYARPLPPASV